MDLCKNVQANIIECNVNCFSLAGASLSCPAMAGLTCAKVLTNFSKKYFSSKK